MRQKYGTIKLIKLNSTFFMDNQLSVEDKSELREVLKKLWNLPEDSQEIVKSGVLKLLENEEKKVEKLVSLKEYLEQEWFIEWNVIFVSKFYALKNKREQSSIIKLWKFYWENYSKNSKSEYSYYEYSLILIKEKFPDLKFDENILTKKEKKNKRKEN